eukprot:CAMPEP_0168330392 /NCGR_PEP_ID=MMETSP0213-20121227/7702_1 /TAXON_ID=151035 /ORGANISM="Euplotes harpa, Strain FSP1.4" /LENGTH=266 /DNA_ID=CAMNT_0008333951 /DNA_START=513 /DNA_END=1313 /DNA_ORIENTATION=+
MAKKHIKDDKENDDKAKDLVKDDDSVTTVVRDNSVETQKRTNKFQMHSQLNLNLNVENQQNQKKRKENSCSNLKTASTRIPSLKNYMKSTISSSKNRQSMSKSKEKSQNASCQNTESESFRTSPYFAGNLSAKQTEIAKHEKLVYKSKVYFDKLVDETRKLKGQTIAFRNTKIADSSKDRTSLTTVKRGYSKPWLNCVKLSIKLTEANRSISKITSRSTSVDNSISVSPFEDIRVKQANNAWRLISKRSCSGTARKANADLMDLLD